MNVISMFVNFCKQLFDSGTYDTGQIMQFVNWGSITPADYKTITGQDYSTPTVEK